MGSTLMALYSPKDNEIDDLTKLIDLILQPGFLAYVGVITSASIVIALYSTLQNKQRKGLAIGHVFISAASGSLAVICVKVLGAIIREALGGKSNYFNTVYAYIPIVILVLLNLVIVHYFNKGSLYSHILRVEFLNFN